MCREGETKEVRVLFPADLSGTGKERWADEPVDACLADLVGTLQVGGIHMRGSCCGHGRCEGHIHLQDGRMLLVLPAEVAEVYGHYYQDGEVVTPTVLDFICNGATRAAEQAVEKNLRDMIVLLKDERDRLQARLAAFDKLAARLAEGPEGLGDGEEYAGSWAILRDLRTLAALAPPAPPEGEQP